MINPFKGLVIPFFPNNPHNKSQIAFQILPFVAQLCFLSQQEHKTTMVFGIIHLTPQKRQE